MARAHQPVNATTHLLLICHRLGDYCDRLHPDLIRHGLHLDLLSFDLLLLGLLALGGLRLVLLRHVSAKWSVSARRWLSPQERGIQRSEMAREGNLKAGALLNHVLLSPRILERTCRPTLPVHQRSRSGTRLLCGQHDRKSPKHERTHQLSHHGKARLQYLSPVCA